ncbi:MAG: energy transducer TonB [Candidatus Marinimicrobia bacterium]|nr:energy transducer TonB [Candidatus Neomarinimicrobiota bacterium]
MILRKKPEVSLKLKYPIVVKNSLVITLVLFIIGLYLFPKFEREITVQQETQTFIEQSEAVVTKMEIQQVQAPSKPAIPVESEDENLDEDIDFELQSFEDFDLDFNDAPPPPPDEDESSGPRVRFIPYDQAPDPIGGFAAIQRNVIYPEIAQEAGIEGTVVVQAFIDENGDVGTCEVLKGIPNTGLNEAAITAIKKTKFKPALQRDRKVGVWISIPVVFKLKG